MSAPASTSSSAAAPLTLSDAEVRLPSWFVPRHYDVALIPDLRAFTFQAAVQIRAEIKQSTRSITLHSIDCTFPLENDATQGIVGQPRVRLLSASGAAASGSLQATAATLDAKTERVRFDFSTDVVPGEYTLSIVYAGVLNDQLAGFYRSSYKGADGSSKYLACTQFEATDARRALPCVDEPAAKATFDVELFVDPALQAVSNMPVLSKTTTQASSLDSAAVNRGLVYPAGLARHRYYTSPIMSTYLLAFVVGEFDYISRVTASGVEVRVYTGLGKTHLGEFSLSTACKALEFYNEYFGIKYPLMKMDLLAIPDFAAGAMENWGCITYRETALLIDAEHSSAAVMQRVARTVCHEIAHMWFGNLVTMEWWSFLWLNEGFARFLEHMAVDHIYPHWAIWQSFVAEVFAQAQSLDSLESSHPVEVTVHHPSEVNEIFDTISYAKGASLIRMLHAAIGEIAFQKGLQSYLRKFSFQNTLSQDLWEAFSESSGQDVAALMDHWVKRIGYPVITASERSGQHLCLCQERFLATYDPKDQSKLHETTWVVPVQVASWKKADLAAGRTEEPHLMKALLNKPEAEFPALGLEDASVLKLNPGQSGFYRVAYSPALFSALADSIPLLPPVERLGVLRDTFALGSSGRTSITQSLELLRHFGGETNYAVVSALAGNLAALASLHQEQPYFPRIQSLVREVFAQNFARLGWESSSVAADGEKKSSEQEEQQLMLFRALVISMLGPVAGSPDIVAEALRRFRAFVSAPLANPIPADLRGSVYSIVAKKGSAEDYEQLRRMYLESELQEEKNRLLSVLGMIDSSRSASASAEDNESKAAADLARIRSVLGLVLAADSPVRPGNIGTLMGGVGSSALGRQEAWKWFTENFDVIAEKFSKGQNFIISGILNGMLGGGSSVEWVAQFESFFATHPIPQAARTIKQLSEAITTKAARLARESAEVEAWLKEKKYE